jgi:hypothetical protein
MLSLIKLQTVGSTSNFSAAGELLGVQWSNLSHNPPIFAAWGIPFAPTIQDELNWILALGTAYLLLAMYLDNVLPRDDRAALCWYYFVTPSYWGIPIGSSTQSGMPAAVVERLNADYTSRNDQDLDREMQRASASAVDAAAGSVDEQSILSFVALRKVYKRNGIVKFLGRFPPFNRWWDERKTADINALKGLYLTAANSNILCVLGQNGAGTRSASSSELELTPSARLMIDRGCFVG